MRLERNNIRPGQLNGGGEAAPPLRREPKAPSPPPPPQPGAETIFFRPGSAATAAPCFAASEDGRRPAMRGFSGRPSTASSKPQGPLWARGPGHCAGGGFDGWFGFGYGTINTFADGLRRPCWGPDHTPSKGEISCPGGIRPPLFPGPGICRSVEQPRSPPGSPAGGAGPGSTTGRTGQARRPNSDRLANAALFKPLELRTAAGGRTAPNFVGTAGWSNTPQGTGPDSSILQSETKGTPGRGLRPTSLPGPGPIGPPPNLRQAAAAAPRWPRRPGARIVGTPGPGRGIVPD